VIQERRGSVQHIGGRDCQRSYGWSSPGERTAVCGVEADELTADLQANTATDQVLPSPAIEPAVAETTDDAAAR
jgi:hypothetical protein